MSDSSSPSQYRTVGILLAIGSGLLIGTSFVFKKRGLLSSQIGHKAGEGVAYLKSVRTHKLYLYLNQWFIVEYTLAYVVAGNDQ